MGPTNIKVKNLKHLNLMKDGSDKKKNLDALGTTQKKCLFYVRFPKIAQEYTCAS